MGRERDELDEACMRHEVVIRDARACVVAIGGALVSIRRALLTGPDLARFCDAVEERSRLHEQQVLLAVFRLDRRFPLPADFGSNLPAFTRARQLVEGPLAAIASVHEFGGVRAAAMRVATRAVWRFGGGDCEHELFASMTAAAQWLAPRAGRVGAPAELGDYVRAYRYADAQLRRYDS